MKYLSLIIIGFTLAVGPSMCSQDCHKGISIVNNSDQTIISAVPVAGNEGCRLDGNTLAPGETEKYFPFSTRTCIESRLESKHGVDTIEIYAVDPSQFNEPNERYHCDSIAANNKILRYYKLTLEDLEQNDFTVTYP